MRTQRRRLVEDFDIGTKLARRAKGWTQAELAREATKVGRRLTGDPEAGVSAAMVCMIERGDRSPSLDVATWLATALDCSPRDLGRVHDTPRPRKASAA